MPSPLTLGLLGGGTLLANLIGNRDAQRRQNFDLDRILKLFSPEGISADTNKLFDMFRASPMYSGLRTRASIGTNATANALQTSFARRGLNTSGIAATALPIARSAHMGAFNDIDMELFAKALQQIMGGRGAQAGVLSNFRTESPLGKSFGTTLDAFLPFLRDALTAK